MIKVKDYIEQMPIYKPPWTNLNRAEYLRLDLNENTLGLPNHVKEALQNYINSDRVQMYPDYFEFMPKLAEYTQVNQENLIVTNGSDQAIEIILRAFLGQNDEFIITQPGFPMFSQIALAIGAKIQSVPYKLNNGQFIFPYEAFIAKIKARAEQIKLIVLINPNNPTGTPILLSDIEKILSLFPTIPVIVDEAYFEFTKITALDLLEAHKNLIITRTFSKAFAMAGLRLGYIISNRDIILEFHKIRGPFDVNNCALIAAEAQINNQKYWQSYINEVINIAKPYLKSFFEVNNVCYYDGQANFLLVKPKHRDKAVEYLKNNKILVRPMVVNLISDTFRMNIGNLEQTRLFTEIYKNYLENFES